MSRCRVSLNFAEIAKGVEARAGGTTEFEVEGLGTAGPHRARAATCSTRWGRTRPSRSTAAWNRVCNDCLAFDNTGKTVISEFALQA